MRYRALSSAVVSAGLGLAYVGCASSGLDDRHPGGGGGGMAGGSLVGGSSSGTGGNPAGGSLVGGSSSGTGGSLVGGSSNGTGGSPAGGSGVAGSGALACPKPTQAMIIDFDTAAAGAADATFGDFATTFSGGTFLYPTTALVSDLSASNWHITGTVSDYCGMGLYFNNCALVDASAYRGISFTISGTINAPTPGLLTMGVSIAADTIASSWYAARDAGAVDPNFGTCVPLSGDQYDGTCADPARNFTIASTAQTVTLLWADFSGGKPGATVDPGQITAIYWYFPWAGSSESPYTVDISIDDLSFVE